MSKQFSALVVGIFVAVLPLRAQSPSVGYVVITPTSGNGGGLTAFETIGNQQGSTITTAVLSATPLSTNALIIVNVGTGQNTLPPNGDVTGTAGITISGGGRSLNTLGSLFSGSSQVNGQLPNPITAQLTSAGSSPVPLFSNTSISILNPNQTTATITATLSDSQGISTTLPTFTVGALQQMSQFLNQFLDSATSITLPLNGFITFSSDMPVAFTAFQFTGSSFATLPVVSSQTTTTIPAIAPGVGGPGALLLPQFISGGGWASQISIVNLTNVPQTVQVDLFGSDGTLQSTFPGQPLLANGVFNAVSQ
jgi:hypothetical protein